MKAIVATKIGSPDYLKLQEVEKPIPKDNEVLIKIHAGTVTIGDAIMQKMRFIWVIFHLFGMKRKKIPGYEVAGTIETIGKDVTKFKIGDEVFGTTSGFTYGGNAEYICLPEEWSAGVLEIKPSSMSFEEAAAVPIGGMTALHILRKGNIHSGCKVLVYGASGSVGSFGVQIAKVLGAEVTGVCSTANIDMVKSLGASIVIDYTKDDFTKIGERFDIIFDAVMKTSFSQCKSSLIPRGVFITVDYPLLQALWTSIVGSRKVVFGIANRIEDLTFLRELIEAGKLKSVIDRCYPLEQTAEAHSYVEKGHKKGNVVITIGHDYSEPSE